MTAIQASLFPEMEIATKKPMRVVNVASVPQRSPFRYAGGKTWLIPTIRKWLRDNQSTLIEPFLGGGSVSLSSVMENLAPKAIMTELDEEVAAVWETILSDECEWLVDRIRTFQMTRENVIELLEKEKKEHKETAFCTIVKNRVFHGGILAAGSGMMKNGEAGKGLASRWYPTTLCNRIQAIHYYRHRFEFHHANAFEFIRRYQDNPNVCFFIDPPYTVAGRRLYKLHDIDHEELFRLVSGIRGHYMLTYDNCDAIKSLADRHNLSYRTIPMTTTHLVEKEELIISDNFD